MPILVQPIAFAVVIEYRAKDPAMAVKVGKLCGLQLRIKYRAAELLQKFIVVPQATSGGTFRIAYQRLVALLFAGIALLRRIHFVAVDFVVPPRQSEIGGDHVRSRMNVADHALARRDGAGESVPDGMTGFGFGNSRIHGCALPGMPKFCINTGVRGVAIISVNYMASGAAARAVIAGMIVGSRKRHDRIEKARFLQAEKYRIGTQLSAKSAIAQFVFGLAGIFFGDGIANLAFLAAAAFEHPQHIAGLRGFPAIKWIKLRKHALRSRLFGRWRGDSLYRFGLAVAVVTLAEAGIFSGVAAIVV